MTVAVEEKAPPAEVESAKVAKHRRKRDKKQSNAKRHAVIAGSVIAVVLAVAIGMHKASQHEHIQEHLQPLQEVMEDLQAAIHDAVNDSVHRVNTTFYRTFNMSLDELVGELTVKLPNVTAISSRLGSSESRLRPGQVAARKGLRAHHPVMLIPGFVTSGLELWSGQPCAETYFRQRLWGALSMAQTLLSDKACWMRHMSLDLKTGGDPPGIKLRAAKALEAVDYFVPGYWVFSKMVQSLADIGYDNNNLVAMPYDWRLPIPVMEQRDGWFTRVKNEAELQYQQSGGTKVVMVSHSYGACVTFAFLTWVEKQQAGWVDKHLESWVNLAGPILGLPKALAPLLSGESRETADLMSGVAMLMEAYLSRAARAEVIRTWGSMLAMLPVGGTTVWGNANWAPDDTENVTAAGRSFGGIIARVKADTSVNEEMDKTKNNTGGLSSEALSLLHSTLHSWKDLMGGSRDEDSDAYADNMKDKVNFLNVTGAINAAAMTAGLQFMRNLQRWSPVKDSMDFEPLAKLLKEQEAKASEQQQEPGPHKSSETEKAQAEEQKEEEKGGEQLTGEQQAQVDTSWPSGGDAKGSSSNGVEVVDPTRVPLPKAPGFKVYCFYGVGSPTERGYHYMKTRQDNKTVWQLNTVAADASSSLESGVQLSPDGDGTVPLLSLGALCEGGWRTKRLNPGKSKVVVREYKNNPWPVYKDPRGGPEASTHVEILGNEPMLLDLINIVTGRGQDTQDLYASNITQIAKNIAWDDI